MKLELGKASIFLFNTLFLCSLIAFPFTGNAQSYLSIDQVIDGSVENNPRFNVFRQNIEYRKGSFRVARSTFNTNLRLTGQGGKDYYPTSLDGSSDPSQNDYWTYSLSASRKIAFGTVITPSVGVYNSGSAISGVETNSGSAFLNIEQPLLRGLGSTYNTANLKVAQLDLSRVQHDYFFEASVLLLNSLTAYVEYIAAYRNLQIQLETEESMDTTVAQLTRLVKFDALPASELVVSNANLSNQRTNTAIAKNRLALSQNLLATAMGIKLEDLKNIGIVPEEFLLTESIVSIDDEYSNSWFNVSKEYRHDYLALANDMEARMIGLDFTKKGLLPRLNLSVGAGYNGIYPSQALDQYYRPFFSNVSGMNYSLGVSFDIAPRYDQQKGQHVQALALSEAVSSNIESLELQMKQEIQKDCDQLRYLLGAVQTVNDAVDYNTKALANEKKKLEMGISTAFNVALMQNTYLNALERQNALLEQLNKAILQFKHHTGSLLTASENNTFIVNSSQLFILPLAP